MSMIDLKIADLQWNMYMGQIETLKKFKIS